ncbi:MAG: hypothetical protein J5944_09295 [Lentisphaeria bacterium]|nr:hypothetical protein [Lentisphaeria bacterium]
MTAAVFLTFSLSLFLDLFFRSHGILSVFTPFCIFYYAVVLNWKTALVLAIASAIPAIVFAGSAWPFDLLTYPAVIGLSLWNRRKTGPADPSLRRHLLCGALIPILIFGPKALTLSFDTFLAFLAWLPPHCVLSAVLLPFVLYLLDLFAEKLGLPLYSETIRKRENPPL